MSSFTEKLRTARTLSGQAAATWARRMLRELPPERSLALVRELERQGMPVELDLEIPSWRTERLVASEHTIEPATTIVIPEHGPLREEAHGWRPYRVRELQGAVLDVDSGLAFSDDRVIAQSGSGTRASRDAAFVSGARVRVGRTLPRVHPGPIAPLGDVTHHYHFMIETLPRLILAKRAQSEVAFLTSEDIPAPYGELLASLGLRTLRVPRSYVAMADPLILVDQPDRFWPRRADIQALRQNLGTAHVASPNRIFIPRGHSSRQPANEARFAKALAEKGFLVTALENLAITEQWRTGQHASTTVGVHGAGLWITAAANSNTQLIELSSGSRFEGCYRRIAAHLGVQYRFLLLPSGQGDEWGRIELDPEELL